MSREFNNGSGTKVLAQKADFLLNEVKHKLDFGPIAEHRKRRAQFHIEEIEIMKEIAPRACILDIGCGKGYVGGELKSKDESLDIFSVDLGDRPTKRMRKITSETFSMADASVLPFPDKSFDGVMVFFVMHHMPTNTQLKLLKEAKRVVKQEGHIFVLEDTVPEFDNSQLEITEKADKRFNPDFFLNKPHNFRSENKWNEVFCDLGLTLQRTVNYRSGKVPHTFFLLSRK